MNRPGSVTKHVNWSDAGLEAVQRLVPIADGIRITLPQLALAWILRRPDVAFAITGTSRPEQVAANAGASSAGLNAAAVSAIDSALGGAPEREPLRAEAETDGILHRG